MHNISDFILFWNNTLHVSDGLSVHHQGSKTVHTASGICHTAQNRYGMMLHVQSQIPDDGRSDRPKHVECCSKIK